MKADTCEQQTARNVAMAGSSTPRRAIYTRQLTRKFATNDSTWRATVDAIRSFDRVRQLAIEQSRWESVMLGLALLGVLCVIVEGELLGLELARLIEEPASASSESLAYSVPFIVLKGVLSGSSVLLLLALAMRYRTSAGLLVAGVTGSQRADADGCVGSLPTNDDPGVVCRIQIERHQLPASATFFSAYSGLRSRFLLEALICLFHMPLVGTNRRILRWGDFDVVCFDQLDVVVFARIYLVGRFLRNQLGLNSTSHNVRLIGAMHQVDLSSIWFAVKFSFQKAPLESTTALLVLDWLLTSAALNFFERASNPTESSASDALWLTIVTITGVGYGDAFPRTLGGKIVIAFGGIIGGMVIACLLRVVLIDALQLSPQEQTVLDVAHFYRYVRQRKASAALLLQQTWRWHCVKARQGSTSHRAHKQRSRVYAAAEAFRLLRFTQPPGLAGAVYSASLWSSSSSAAANMNEAVARRMQQMQAQVAVRRAGTCDELQRTAQLFRKIAATSSA